MREWFGRVMDYGALEERRLAEAGLRNGLTVPIPAVGIGDDPTLVTGRRG